MLERGSGVLLHISSLPGPHGVGDLGQAAREFIDFLTEAKQRYWQLLPLNPTDTIYNNSPYSSPSAFAANDLFIDPEALVKGGWLTPQEVSCGRDIPGDRVHYQDACQLKKRFLDMAFGRFRSQAATDKEYRQFCETHAGWLPDYALFVCIKAHFNGQMWNLWPQPFRLRDQTVLAKFHRDHEEEIERTRFSQFVFFQQWKALKDYAHHQGVKLIGDIPIYVNFDSADVWANPGIFKLDEQGSPLFVAGVPPDYFSQTGQRWGNPVYDWDRLKELDYDWWLKRIQHNLVLFDHLRIDHFRGLVGYWQIPVQEETAVNGEWVPGPGEDFFLRLKTHFPRLPIIAEDLGIITPDVTEAMHKFHFPGMKVMLFAFSDDLETHPYIPENFPAECVAYTGTHDNNTVKGWLRQEAGDKEKENLRIYFHKKVTENNLPWLMIHALMKSKAKVVLIPAQDLLGLGPEARMNIPGTAQGNWEWRSKERTLTTALAKKMAVLAETTHREAKRKKE